MNDLISAIITTYNRTNELKRALESLINQTYTNIEIIVVDDNKDEKISKKVKEIVDDINDERIKLIKNKENIGGSLSRNVGINNAKGDYIAFLDDDDEYLPEKIEKQYECFMNSNFENLALVYCYCKAVKDGKTIQEYKYDYIGNCLVDGMKMCIAATSQWMCKKQYLKNVGNFSNVPCKQDSTVIVKLLAAGYCIDRVPEILSIYHEEDGVRISNNNVFKKIEGETKLLELCRKNYDKVILKDQKEIEYEFAIKLANYYYIAKDYNNYKKCIKLINKTHPFSKKTIEIKIRILKKKIRKLN